MYIVQLYMYMYCAYNSDSLMLGNRMSTLFQVPFVSIHYPCNDSDNCEQQDKNTAQNERKGVNERIE